MVKGYLKSIQEPEVKYRRKLYNVYESIFESKLNKNKQINLLTYLFAWEDWSWRVVGISYNAINKIKNNNFIKPKGLVRGHIQDRNQTYKKFINEKYEFDRWWQCFWENDKTLIVTKEENNNKDKDKNLNPKHIPIDYKEGYFVNAGLIGFKCRKTLELKYCEKLCKDYKRKLSNL